MKIYNLRQWGPVYEVYDVLCGKRVVGLIYSTALHKDPKYRWCGHIYVKGGASNKGLTLMVANTAATRDALFEALVQTVDGLSLAQ